MMTFGLLALIGAAIFTGVALYVKVVEQPARLSLDDRALLTNGSLLQAWRAMQAPLALVGLPAGIDRVVADRTSRFLIGAVAIIAPVPWTLVAIKPVNDTLMATEPDQAGPQTRALVVRWGALHGVRTALGALATAAFLWACIPR